MTDYVLVPGGWHGAWWLEPLAQDLRQHGHGAFAASLTGVGERRHLDRGVVNLDTQVEDVERILDYERLDDVVLFAHSFGGILTTSVADRRPERVRALVYADAQVPADGDSLWSLTNQESRELFIRAATDGVNVQPPPGLDERATSHPLACFVQPARITGRFEQVRSKHYVYLRRWVSGLGESPLKPFFDRLSCTPGWQARERDSNHDFMSDAREDMVRLLLDV